VARPIRTGLLGAAKRQEATDEGLGHPALPVACPASPEASPDVIYWPRARGRMRWKRPRRHRRRGFRLPEGGRPTSACPNPFPPGPTRNCGFTMEAFAELREKARRILTLATGTNDAGLLALLLEIASQQAGMAERAGQPPSGPTDHGGSWASRQASVALLIDPRRAREAAGPHASGTRGGSNRVTPRGQSFQARASNQQRARSRMCV
jgi:hypothetical protein